jgi:DNA replication licensing factor MCM7
VAKQYQPFISKDLTDYITSVYVNIREEGQTDTEMMTFVSARTLLAILRLATALARLRFSNQVVQDDVEEALRLMHMSKATLLDAHKEGARRKDPTSEIFTIIRNLHQQTGQKRINVADAQARVLAQGYKLDQFNTCLDEYETLNVWSVNESRTRLQFA